MCYMEKRRWERNIEGSTSSIFHLSIFELFDLPSLDFELSIFHPWISSFRSSILGYRAFDLRSLDFELSTFDLWSSSFRSSIFRLDLPSFDVDLGLDSESRIGKSTTAISSSGRPGKTGQPGTNPYTSPPLSAPLYRRPGPVQEPTPPPCKNAAPFALHTPVSHQRTQLGTGKHGKRRCLTKKRPTQAKHHYPGREAYAVCHSRRKCKDRLVFIVVQKRSLYSRPEWYYVYIYYIRRRENPQNNAPTHARLPRPTKPRPPSTVLGAKQERKRYNSMDTDSLVVVRASDVLLVLLKPGRGR